MSRLCATLLALSALSLPLGCRRESDPPPRYLAMSGKLIPVRIPQRVLDQSRDKSVLGSAARPDEAAPAGPNARGETSGAIEIDDSAADGVVQAYVEMMATGQLLQLQHIVLPEQQEAARQFVEMAQPVNDAKAQLARVLEETFPGHAIQLGQLKGALAMLNLAEGLTVAEVTVDSAGDEAEATLQDEESSQELALTLKQTDGRWRIELPKVLSARTPEELATLGRMCTKAADGWRDLADRIESGEITDEQTAEESFKQVVAEAEAVAAISAADMSEIDEETSKGILEPDEEEPIVEEPAGERESPAKSTAKPGREREEVDEVYSGPGMLRAR